MRDLLIGCGSQRDRRAEKFFDFERLKLRLGWGDLVTLDNESSHKPDVVADLNDSLPFGDNEFDEIHAYEVLEHLGKQGDYVSFFAQFSELWRVLRPGGLLMGTTPGRSSRWVWGDPSHTRYIGPESFVFLSQAEYARQVGERAMSDFRGIYRADFEPVRYHETETFAFILRAVKPSRSEA